ncbi:MAG: J domain-containing protein, partial [Bdellovibrionales bacterium]|nr:J domain-containing protein [Bdellovibrionales bacterium]
MCALCCWLIGYAATGLADDLFVINGLSFSCPSCEQLGDGMCRVPLGNAPVALPCETARLRLLSRDDVVEASHPTERELLSALTTERFSAEQLAQLLVVLAKRRSDPLAPGVARAILKRQGERLIAALLHPAARVPGCKLLQAMGPGNDVALDASLRAILAMTLPAQNLASLADDLQLGSDDQQRTVISQWVELAKELRPEWVHDLGTLALSTERCPAASLSRGEVERCLRLEATELSPRLADYVQRRKFATLRASARSNLTASDTLRFVALLQGANESTVDLEPLMRSALNQLRRLPAAEQDVALRQPGVRHLVERHSGDVGKTSQAASSGSVATSGAIPLLLALLFLALGIAAIRRLIRFRNDSLEAAFIETTSSMPAAERAELQRLLQEFRLPLHAQVTELSQAFRSRAKALHPDRNPSSKPEE